MPEWTSAQRQVIDSSAQQLICSAAAGSGKTAVMVERILRVLREGEDPSSFLIITFTNAAASEMREKIRRRLQQERKNPFLQNALDQLDLMQISTIHAFCQQLIRNQFQLIEIDPDFQICDTSQRIKLFHEAFLEACNQLEEEQNELFLLLRTRMDVKKAEDTLRRLQAFLFSLPAPFQWMQARIDQIPGQIDSDHPWFQALRSMAKDYFHLAEVALSRMYGLFSESFFLESYRAAWKADAEMFHVKQMALNDDSQINSPCVFERLKTPRGLTIQESDWKSRYQELREQFKKNMQQIDDLLLIDPEKTIEEWTNMKQTLQALQMLMERTEKSFQKKKKERALVEFQDLEQYAVQILSDPLGQEEACAIWRHVFVDECQDISAVQDRIIDLLHPDQDSSSFSPMLKMNFQAEKHDLFMVGDVKQSIYRFRLADPLLFLNRIQQNRNQKRLGREIIFLQSNFRSRPEILETTNQVFRTVMRASATEIEYGPEEELFCGRKTEGNIPVQGVIIAREDLEQSPLEATANFIQAELKNLMQEPCPGENRNYLYRDCVILMPAVQKEGPLLAHLLEERGIPVFVDGEGDYYQRPEIQVIRNLLSWVENPLQDLPLISVLENAPFFFSAEDLAQIRLRKAEKDVSFYEAFLQTAAEKSLLGEKCRAVQSRHEAFQQLAAISHLGELIWALYHETGYYYLIASEPGGEAKQANLRMLAHQATEAESRGILTLRQFIAFLSDQQAYGDQQAATLLGDQDNLVRIMTVHKSKGLQFPVVFCAGMDKGIVFSEGGDLRFHARLGLCVHYKDPSHRISRPTLADDIFSWTRRREEISEKVRLLYVAMTRAQERLYLLTCQETNPIWSMPEGEARILSATCFTDWWMPVLMQGTKKISSTGYSQSSNPYEIRIYKCNQQKNVENKKVIHNSGEWLQAVVSAPVVDNLWKTFPEIEDLPPLRKRSVTTLIHSARLKLEDDEEETPELKRSPDPLLRRLQQMEMPEAPAFLRAKGKVTGAWRGTLAHRILSLMSLDRLREGIPAEQVFQEEKERMIREHMATREELRQVPASLIVSFWHTEIGERILRSPEVHREWNFNLFIRREEEILLQGIIDCAFLEAGEWVILDYKTDRNKTQDQLIEEYRPQLLWYVRALEELSGRKVREAALYSLTLEKLIPVYEK